MVTDASRERSLPWYSSKPVGLPLVVRNDDRNKYIGALESADNGDLKPLVSFFSNLQKQAFIKAIGIARDTEQATLFENAYRIHQATCRETA